MSRDPIVASWRGAKFAGVDFARFVTSWEDTRDRTGTVHRYNKRDGGEAEDMGRDTHKATVHLAFIGSTWRSDFLALQAAIDANPIGSLTHPLYGSMQAYCRRSSGRMDIESSPNLYEVTLFFEESQLDTNASADNAITTQGPGARQQNVNAAITAMATYSALFATAASAIASMTSAATSYSTAAVAAASTLTPNSSLDALLSSVLASTNAAITAIVADPAYAPGAGDQGVWACETLYDACATLDDAVKSLRPQLSLFTVPQTMHITALSQLFYGPADGPRREAEIITNNAGVITDPAFILQGTRIRMAPPTV